MSRNTFMAITFLQLVLVLQVVLYEFLLRCTRAEDATECFMAVLPLDFPRGFSLCDKLLGVRRQLVLQQVNAVRTGYVDVYVDGSCFHNRRCLEFLAAKIVQIERNTKGKLVFLCISEMQPIFEQSTKTPDESSSKSLEGQRRRVVRGNVVAYRESVGKWCARCPKSGVTQTGYGGVTQTGTLGVTHTDFEAPLPQGVESKNHIDAD